VFKCVVGVIDAESAVLEVLIGLFTFLFESVFKFDDTLEIGVFIFLKLFIDSSLVVFEHFE